MPCPMAFYLVVGSKMPNDDDKVAREYYIYDECTVQTSIRMQLCRDNCEHCDGQWKKYIP